MMIALARATVLLVACTAAEAQPRESRAAAPMDRVKVTTEPQQRQHNTRCDPHQQRQLDFLVSTSRLVGRPVRDSERVPVGTVRDVLFGEDGAATAVIVTGSPWRLAARRYFRIPWEALEFQTPEPGIVASLPLAEMESFRWRLRHAAVQKGEIRARVVIRSKVLLENRARYGSVRDVLFELDGDLHGLVIVPAPKFGDKRTQRAPHVYRSHFDVDASRRRIKLPHRAQAVPRLEAATRPDYDSRGEASGDCPDVLLYDARQ